jgi:hypothetical protein
MYYYSTCTARTYSCGVGWYAVVLGLYDVLPFMLLYYTEVVE